MSLPLKAYEGEVTCLESLVGVKADCTTNTAFHYIEDIEGCDISTLAAIANVQSPSGKALGADIISQAAREMLGDIDMAGGGMQMTDTFGDICSACNFQSNYFNGGGIKVQKVVSSPYSRLKIFQIDVATNFTGDAVLAIHDGVTERTFAVTLVAGQMDTLKINYETDQRLVKIYFQGNNIPVARIDCPVVRTCGCGGGAANSTAMDTIRYTGLINGVDTDVQYGFKICGAVVCDSSLLVCDLIRQAPKAFAMTLLYKVGAKYYSESRESTRINRVAGRNGEEKKDMNAYYTKLYNQRLRGVGDSKSIESIIKIYLRQRKSDRCVVCESKNKTAWVTG